VPHASTAHAHTHTAPATHREKRPPEEICAAPMTPVYTTHTMPPAPQLRLEIAKGTLRRKSAAARRECNLLVEIIEAKALPMEGRTFFVFFFSSCRRKCKRMFLFVVSATGSCDPYTVIQLDHKEESRTHTVWNSTEPHWHHEVYLYRCSLLRGKKKKTPLTHCRRCKGPCSRITNKSTSSSGTTTRTGAARTCRWARLRSRATFFVACASKSSSGSRSHRPRPREPSPVKSAWKRRSFPARASMNQTL